MIGDLKAHLHNAREIIVRQVGILNCLQDDKFLGT
jgi:hypothetical protein